MNVARVDGFYQDASAVMASSAFVVHPPQDAFHPFTTVCPAAALDAALEAAWAAAAAASGAAKGAGSEGASEAAKGAASEAENQGKNCRLSNARYWMSSEPPPQWIAFDFGK